MPVELDGFGTPLQFELVRAGVRRGAAEIKLPAASLDHGTQNLPVKSHVETTGLGIIAAGRPGNFRTSVAQDQKTTRRRQSAPIHDDQQTLVAETLQDRSEKTS